MAVVTVNIAIIAAIAFVVYKYQPPGSQPQFQGQNEANPTQPSPLKDQAAQDNKSNSQPEPKWWYVLVTWPNGIGAWLVLLTLEAIIWQSIATSRAATATEQAVVAADKAYVLAEDTAKRQLRAYFGIPEGKLYMFDDGIVEARLIFKNCGQTPAYELEIVTCGRFEEHGVQYSPPGRDPNLRSHPHIVGGGSPYHFTCRRVQSGRGKDALLNDFALGHLAFRIYGKCTYRDAFQDPHFIDFQLFVGGGAIVQYTTDPDQGALTMLTDSKGNSAD